MEQLKANKKDNGAATVITALFILIRIYADMNGTHWFTWFWCIAIPICIQLGAWLIILILPGLGEKIGQAIYFRQLERTQAKVLKKAAQDAKDHQHEQHKAEREKWAKRQ